jgi:quercetin dioxygenase-like cupin family protein
MADTYSAFIVCTTGGSPDVGGSGSRPPAGRPKHKGGGSEIDSPPHAIAGLVSIRPNKNRRGRMIIKTNEEISAQTIVRNIKRFALLAGVALALLLTSSFVAGTAMATRGNGVTGTPLASGVLPEPVRVKLKDEGGFGEGTLASSITTIKYTVQPGGYFGWHQHGGPVWAVIASGTLTLYDGDDPTCTGQAYPAGSAFLDSGSHTHNARNETNQLVEVVATFMLPAGGPIRIDMPDPGVCPF